MIGEYEIEFEQLCQNCIEECQLSLPVFKKGELLSNCLIDKEVIITFSKCCTIYSKHCIDKGKRIVKPISLTGNIDPIPLFFKAKSLLEDALSFDPNNPIVLNDLITAKLMLKESNIGETIKHFDFARYETKHKARLCSGLLNSGYDREVKSLLSRFGNLYSNDIKVINDLAFCYISVGQLRNAANVLRNIVYPNKYTIQLLKTLVRKMPANSFKWASDKILFATMVVENMDSTALFYKNVVCETLYKSGSKRESYSFFVHKIYTPNSDLGTALSKQAAFEKLSRPWDKALIKFLAENILNAEILIDQQNRFVEAISRTTWFLKNLLELPIAFKPIEDIYQVDDSIENQIRAIVRKSVNILGRIIELSPESSEKAFDAMLSFLK